MTREQATREVDAIIDAFGWEMTDQQRETMYLMAMYDNQSIEAEYLADRKEDLR